MRKKNPNTANAALNIMLTISFSGYFRYLRETQDIDIIDNDCSLAKHTRKGEKATSFFFNRPL